MHPGPLAISRKVAVSSGLRNVWPARGGVPSALKKSARNPGIAPY